MTRWQKCKWFWYWSLTGKGHPDHVEFYKRNPQCL